MLTTNPFIDAPVTSNRPAGSPSDGNIASLVGEFAHQNQRDVSSEIEFNLMQDLVRSFTQIPILARRSMRELLSRAPEKFYAGALQILKTTPPGPGLDYLTSLLLENNLLLMALADPDAFPAETAIPLAANLYRLDPQLDSKLMQYVLRQDGQHDGESRVQAIERVLEVLDAISDCTRLVTSLMKLLRHPNQRLQSKAARMLVRAHRNPEWLSQQINHEDPRVRSNVIEGMLVASPGTRELGAVWKAVEDSHHRVSSTAWLVLYHNGHAERATTALLAQCEHRIEMHRAAAAWALGETRSPVFLAKMQLMARSDQGHARRMALKSAVKLRKVPMPEIALNGTISEDAQSDVPAGEPNA